MENDNYYYFPDKFVLNVSDSNVTSNLFFINLVRFNGVVYDYNSSLHLDRSSIPKIVVNKSIFKLVHCGKLFPSFLISVSPISVTYISPLFNYINL